MESKISSSPNARKAEATLSHSSSTHRYRTKEQNILEWQQITFHRLINKHCYDSTSMNMKREQKSQFIMKFHCCRTQHLCVIWKLKYLKIWERERENYAGQYLSELIINSNRWNQSILFRLFDVRLWSVKRGYKFFFSIASHIDKHSLQHHHQQQKEPRNSTTHQFHFDQYEFRK